MFGLVSYLGCVGPEWDGYSALWLVVGLLCMVEVDAGVVL